MLLFHSTILLWGPNKTSLMVISFGKIKIRHEEFKAIICPDSLNYVAMLVFNLMMKLWTRFVTSNFDLQSITQVNLLKSSRVVIKYL